MQSLKPTSPHYGPQKSFRTSKGTVLARTKAEAAKKANVEVADVQGPKFSDALRGEPSGNRKHQDVTYLGIRGIVRRMNRKAA